MGATSEYSSRDDFAGGSCRSADPDDIVDQLASGAAVLLVGPVGTGKTVTITRVARALAQRKTPSQLIRGMARMQTALVGAHAPPAPGTILLVDDAHDLDRESASVLIEAVCRQGVAVCFTVQAPTVADAPADPVTAALLDLGTRGFAQRIDLEPLGEAEALSFLRARGAGALDDVTVDVIVWLANGSRALLRELADIALDAERDGRDPLSAIREVPVWTRLADTVQSHLGALSDEHLSTLVALHRFPGLASSHAARIRPAHEVDALRAGGYLHRDESDAGALWANPLLAQGAARVLGAQRVHALVDSSISRMLEGGGRWWSPPIATALADVLLGGRPLAAPVSAEVGRRALRDAARWHNDHGRYASAEAYAAMGISGGADDAGLQLELAHARVSAGESGAESLVPAVISGEDDCARALELSAAWGVRGFASSAQELRSALERGSCASEDHRPVFAMIDALRFSLEWREARDAAQDAAGATTGRWRVCAWLTEAYARAELGDAEGAERLLARVDEYVLDGGMPGLATAERLWVLIVQLVTHLVLGEDAPAVHERIVRERRRAAREGDARVLGIAGLAMALSAAVTGDSDAAVKSLDVARTRYLPLRQDVAVANVKLWIAQFLARNGRAQNARDISVRVEMVWADGPLALRHACAATRSVIDALDQRYDEAAGAVREALALSSARHAPMRRARDLYRAVALGVVGEDSLLEIRGLLFDGRARLEELMSHPPPRSFRDQRHAQLRVAFLRTLIATSPSVPTVEAAALRRLGAVDTSPSLTRRECEIAGLIAAGMSNREIADHLFISVRTVESHIYQARGKVGASSRRDLGEHSSGSAVGA